MKKPIFTAAFLLIFFLSFRHYSFAQQAGKQVPIKVSTGKGQSDALLYLPPDYNKTTKKYPLILFGHGIGERVGLEALARQGLPGIISNNNPPYAMVNGEKIQFIVLSILFPSGWASYTAMSNGARDLIKRGFRIDSSRIYITGLSAGAKAAIYYIPRQRSHNLIEAAAAVPMSYTDPTWWVPDDQLQAFQKKGMWCFTGASDVHTEVATTAVNRVNSLFPGHARLTVYPGGHCCWMTYYDPNYRETINGKKMNIYEWMYQYSCNDKISASSSSNVMPVAEAGKDQTVTLPTNTVTLNGSASDRDGSIISYKWTKRSGPDDFDIDNAGAASTKVTGLEEGVYVFTLTVKDNDGTAATDNVTITVKPAPNRTPVAKAGRDQTITLPVDVISLDGSASSDPDGEISSYRWTQQSGPAKAKIENDNDDRTKVSGLEKAGTYVFVLTVMDNRNTTSASSVSVTVEKAPNKQPVANAGKDQTIRLPESYVYLDGHSSSDPDGEISSYRWTQQSGPAKAKIENDNDDRTKVSGLEKAGTYVFVLTVMDNRNTTSASSVSVTVEKAPNKQPVANAGKDQTIRLPESYVYLDGHSSSDPDGKISSFEWTQQSGPAKAKIEDDNDDRTKVSGLEKAGTYVFVLTVTDNRNTTSTSSVSVTVEKAPNKQPVANAGKDQTIRLPESYVYLDGHSSSDPDGKISSFEWTQQSGPAKAKIEDDNDDRTKVSGLEKAGTYVFVLTVTDNRNTTSTSSVSVTVESAPNQPPHANAGKDQTIRLPKSYVYLDGHSSSDPDGKISSYEWTQQSGPSKAKIEDDNDDGTKVSGLKSGSYVFVLKVIDNKKVASSDQVTIHVEEARINQKPVADAGESQTITLPTSSVHLNGSASKDPDGKIVAWHWVKKSGPWGIRMYNSHGSKATVWGLKSGTYVFTLTVTDDRGKSSSDKVTITVNAGVASKLIANAGKNRNIAFPKNSVILDGTASKDPNGKIVSWDWVKKSGPWGIRMYNSNDSKATVWGLKPGKYVFTLTVIDNKGRSSSDQVTINVYDQSNKRPIANAGKDRSITLPVNVLVLNGSASMDPNGKIVAWHWVKKSGPWGIRMYNSRGSKAKVWGLKPGTYVFTLTVKDNRGSQSSDKVTITVTKAPHRMYQVHSGEDTSEAKSDSISKTIAKETKQVTTNNKNIMAKPGLDNYKPYRKDTSSLTFKVYPNPVHDQLHIELNKSGTGFVRFRFIDINGRLIKTFYFGRQGKFFKQSIDVSSLPDGIYFIQLLEDDQLRKVDKIIKL